MRVICNWNETHTFEGWQLLTLLITVFCGREIHPAHANTLFYAAHGVRWKKRKGKKTEKKKKQSEIWCVKLPFRCSQMAIFTLPCHCKVGESPGAWSWEGEPVLLKTNRAQNIPHSFVRALSPTILHVCEYKKETTTQKDGCANDLQVSRVRKGPNGTVVYSFLLCPPLGDRNCFTPLPPWIETLLRTW